MTSTWKRWFSLPCFECIQLNSALLHSIRYNLCIFESTQLTNCTPTVFDSRRQCPVSSSCVGNNYCTAVSVAHDFRCLLLFSTSGACGAAFFTGGPTNFLDKKSLKNFWHQFFFRKAEFSILKRNCFGRFGESEKNF